MQPPVYGVSRNPGAKNPYPKLRFITGQNGLDPTVNRRRKLYNFITHTPSMFLDSSSLFFVGSDAIGIRPSERLCIAGLLLLFCIP